MTQKNRHLGTIAQICRAIILSSQLRHASTIGKKSLLNSNVSSVCPHNIAICGPLAAEIVSLVRCTQSTFNGFRILAALGPTARNSRSGCQPNFAAFNRGCHLYSAGRPLRWAFAHILLLAVLRCMRLCICMHRPMCCSDSA